MKTEYYVPRARPRVKAHQFHLGARPKVWPVWVIELVLSRDIVISLGDDGRAEIRAVKTGLVTCVISDGDWLVVHEDGTFDVLPDDAFGERYEPAKD